MAINSLSSLCAIVRKGNCDIKIRFETRYIRPCHIANIQCIVRSRMYSYYIIVIIGSLAKITINTRLFLPIKTFTIYPEFIYSQSHCIIYCDIIIKSPNIEKPYFLLQIRIIP